MKNRNIFSAKHGLTNSNICRRRRPFRSRRGQNADGEHGRERQKAGAEEGGRGRKDALRCLVRHATKIAQRSSNPPMPGLVGQPERPRSTPETIGNKEKGVRQTRESGVSPNGAHRDVG